MAWRCHLSQTPVMEEEQAVATARQHRSRGSARGADGHAAASRMRHLRVLVTAASGCGGVGSVGDDRCAAESGTRHLGAPIMQVEPVAVADGCGGVRGLHNGVGDGQPVARGQGRVVADAEAPTGEA
jgi:hypothetical protein